MENYKNDNSIPFYPILAKITKSIKAGLLLSYLINWNVKGNQSRVFFKTIDEIEQETTLTKSEQETVIKKLKKLNLIDFKKGSLPYIKRFKINYKTLFELVENYKNNRI